MTTITHTLTGLALGKLVFTSIGAPAFNIDSTTFIIYSGLMSNFPDLNIFWKKDLYLHHEDLTHYPIIPFVLMIVLASVAQFVILPIELLIIPVLWLFHIFFDLYGIRAGVYVFWPFNRKEFSITKLEKLENVSISKKIDIAIKNGQIIFEVVAFTTALIFLLT